MSSNQSRLDRTESQQYRNSGRSNRNFTGGGSKASSTGSGGGATAPPPSSVNSNNSNTNNPTLSTNRSFKKHNNVQGGQPSRGGAASGPAVNSNSSTGPRPLQNGVHVQQPSHGTADLPVTNTTVNPATFRPPDMASPKASRAPRAPPSLVAAANNDSKPPTTPVLPAKAPADGSFSLQFGSISPSYMNGMQVPPRTTSAPPNLDEQKREQARHDILRAKPTLPTPPAQSVPKQQPPKKDVGMIDQSNTADVQATLKPKRDAHVSASPPVSQQQKQSIHSIPGIPMQMPFHQQQVPVQFGGPNPQIQAQAMSASLPMTMQVPLQNHALPQMFVSGLQPHPMQSQGLLHQGQNLSFTSHLGPQLPPQLGNVGMNLSPQFPQQQATKYGTTRKPVKITHPDTHEELRLDGSPGPRSHSNVPQSHPISSFPPAHTLNYYPTPGTYNAGSIFFSPTTSLPLNNPHPPTSQPSRHFSQVTVKPAIGSNVEKDPASSVSSPRAAKVESVKLSRPSQKDSQTPTHSQQQLKPGIGQASASLAGTAKAAAVLGSASVHGQASISLTSSTTIPALDSTASVAGENSRLDAGGALTSGKNEQHVDKEHTLKDEVGGNSAAVSSVPIHKEPEGAVGKVISSPVTNISQDVRQEPVTTAGAAQSDAFGLNHDQAEELKASDSLKLSVGARPGETNQLNPEAPVKQEKGENVHEDSKKELHDIESLPESNPTVSSKISNVIEEGSLLKGNSIYEGSDAQDSKESLPRKLQSSEKFHGENDRGPNFVARSSMPGDGNGEIALSTVGVTGGTDTSLESESRPANMDTEANVIMESTVSDDAVLVSSITRPEENLKGEDESVNHNGAGSVTSLSSDVKEKSLPESHAVKSAAPRGKRKMKELLKKYENTAPTSDLYLAYKGPEEKKEVVTSTEVSDTGSSSLEEVPSHVSLSEVSNENAAQSKVEPEDWEDAAEIPTPKLEASQSGNQVLGSGEDGIGVTKKYSRDFLFTFAKQCTALPEGFEFAPDVAEALMASNVYTSSESYPGTGRIIDRPNTASRPDRHGSGMVEEDKWNKFPGQHMSVREMRVDMTHGPNVGVRPNQSGNYGVLRNPRMQTPIQYPPGILTGPMPTLGPQVVIPRNNADSDRWLRGTSFQKGLMPSPQTPMQVMHKTENKYEVGKVSDEEEVKQRQLKAILNKLTPQNFEKLFEQVKQVNIDNDVTLTGIISQIFDKALMEPTFCEMYANFCHHLAQELPDLSVDNQKITFKRLLLNKCQEEFERGEREQEEANKADDEGTVKQTEEEREDKRLKARRRMLGNIRLIGELYKKRMLTERIMHECIKKLLGQYQNPDEEDVEALCKLMSTIGEMIDHPKAKEHMDAYFDMMKKLSNNMKLSSRVRFMLKDSIDLRKNKWQQRRKVEGPKKIEDLHRDAAQERQAQTTRLARTPSIGSSVRRQPMDFSPRGSMPTSQSSQLGGFRAVPSQLRGHGVQDARVDDRHVLDNRMLSAVPLPQRPLGDDSITLGPQGGLARGMAFRGHSASPGIPDVLSTGDSRRMGVGVSGYDPNADRSAYSSREEPLPRQDRLSAYDQHQPSRDSRNTDHSFDRSLSLSSAARGGTQTSIPSASSERMLPDDRLRDMSLAAIKEFYSAKDHKEVAFCVKELNNPNFYPNMISLWVTDSFERKDMERDLLAKLLVYLSKSEDGMISQNQLINGFESVLMNLEDAVNDAPRAGEFLGRVFARLALENVVPFNDISRLIYEGGEEPGRLIEIGLASEVLGTVLEIITAEGGDSMLNEMRSSSKIRLESFRPPGSTKPGRLDKFI